MLLRGKVAIVTGATSGIGAATAMAFAEAGAKVVVSGRSSAGAESTAALIASIEGDSRIMLGDVTDPVFCDELVAFAVAEFGRVDVLANVAGTITRGDATETTDEEWYQNMRVNADSVFFMSRAVVRQMRAQAPIAGTIVNLASNVGLVGSAGLPAYCASKGAVVLLTKAMALDHAAEGIRINALCPGAVDTPMLVSAHEKTVRTPDDVFSANIAGIPEGRIPEPTEIAKSMVYLASEQSSHVTGIALPIDGGYSAG
jgi:2,3-dihydro-2,3-dihydroxybenzoate dehydrogenase